MNIKIIFTWIAVILFEVLFVRRLKSACHDPGGCGFWFGNVLLFNGDVYYYMLLIVPLIIAIALSYLWRNKK